MKKGVPKRSYRSDLNIDSLILPEEFDVDVLGELPGLKLENGDEGVLLREEDDVIENELEALRRTADPVRIYLREMGSFPLLTREGEVEIAKRIEGGQQEVMRTLFNCPIAIREIIHLGEELREERMKVKEVTEEIDDEEKNINLLLSTFQKEELWPKRVKG